MAETYEPNLDDGFEVAYRDDLSLNDLVDIQDQGDPMMRTSHVGNQNLHNSAVYDAGIRGVLFDRNQPARDQNYHPGHVIVGGEATLLLEDEQDARSTTHLSVEAAGDLGNRDIMPGEPIESVHMRSLEQVFPSANLVTLSEYMRDNEAVLGVAVKELTEVGLLSWTRYMDEEGVEHTVEHDDENPTRFGIFRDGNPDNEQSGMIMPLDGVIIGTSIADAIRYGTDQVYHLGGPDMPKYMADPARQAHLQEMYAALKDGELGTQLPDRLVFHMVPAAALSFVSTKERQPALDAMLDTHTEISRYDTELADTRKYIAQTLVGDERKSAINGIGQVVANNRRGMGEVKAMYPEAFKGTQDKDYTTQYDVSDQGGLYVPEMVRHAPMRQLFALHAELSKAAQKAKG